MARRLLTIADRIDADYFTLPQEFMAQMLGVHRPTVSLTLQTLRQRGIVVTGGAPFPSPIAPGSSEAPASATGWCAGSSNVCSGRRCGRTRC